MPRNVEIKARIDSVEAVLPQISQLIGDDVNAETIDQHDTFYKVAYGRLKLRVHADRSGELIQYQREDSDAARASDYLRVPAGDPPALHEALSRALGVIGHVTKRRRLLVVERGGHAVRIHLDRVEGRGDFIEIEVAITDDQTEAAGIAVADALMAELRLADAPRVAGAYVDITPAAG